MRVYLRLILKLCGKEHIIKATFNFNNNKKSSTNKLIKLKNQKKRKHYSL